MLSPRRRWATVILGVLGGVAVLVGFGWAYVWMFPGEFACDDTGQYETIHREVAALPLDGVEMTEWCDTDGITGPTLTGHLDNDLAGGLRTALADGGWTRVDPYQGCESFRRASTDGEIILDLCQDERDVSISFNIE